MTIDAGYEPVYGPAWEPLVTSGLLVWRGGIDPNGAVGPLREYVVGVVGKRTPEVAALTVGWPLGVWIHALSTMEEDPGLVPLDADLLVDYANPHTFDRCERAIGAWLGRSTGYWKLPFLTDILDVPRLNVFRAATNNETTHFTGNDAHDLRLVAIGLRAVAESLWKPK